MLSVRVPEDAGSAFTGRQAPILLLKMARLLDVVPALGGYPLVEREIAEAVPRPGGSRATTDPRRLFDPSITINISMPESACAGARHSRLPSPRRPAVPSSLCLCRHGSHRAPTFHAHSLPFSMNWLRRVVARPSDARAWDPAGCLGSDLICGSAGGGNSLPNSALLSMRTVR